MPKMHPQRNYKYDNEGDLGSIYRNYKVAMYESCWEFDFGIKEAFSHARVIECNWSNLPLILACSKS
jgi:hypothetical protein